MGIRIDGASDLINATDGSLTVDGLSINVTGIVTASSGFQVGSAATIHSTGQINSTNIVVSAGSSIGIGTDNPDTLLHVYKSGVHGGLHANSDAPLIVENNGNCVIDIASIHTGIGGVYFSDTGASGKGKIEYKHGDDYMTFGVNGSERARIDSSGRLLVNTTSSRSCAAGDHKIQIEATSTEGLSLTRTTADAGGINISFIKTRNGAVVQSGDDCGAINWFADDGTDTNSYTARIQAAVDGTPGSNDTPGRLVFSTTSDGNHTTDERMRLDSSGRLLIGHTASRAVGNVTSQMQLEGTDASTGISICRNSNNASPPYISLAKSRAGSVAGNTVIQDGDGLGSILFSGADGTDITNNASSITAYIDGTPGGNDTPGRLVFATTADGGTSPTERLRINSSGNIMTGGLSTPLGYGYHGATSTTLTIYDGNANAGVLEVGGNPTLNSYNAGSIAFINNNNANGSTPWDSQSKFVHLIRAQIVTSDNNAGDDSGADLVFYRKPEAEAGTEGMRIKSTGDVSLANGNLVVASGHGIDFAATGGPDSGASGSSELLDDYEEGSWSGVVMDGGSTNISINNVVARYVKIGQYVHCYFNITRNETGSRSGTVQFWQLPFTALNSTLQVCGTFWLDEGGVTNGDSVGGAIYIHSNTNNAQFVHPTTDAQQSANRYLQYSEWSQHRPIYGSFSYMTQD